MQSARVAHVGEGQAADQVGADRLDLVVLAPVHVGAPGDAGGVEDVRGLVLLSFGVVGVVGGGGVVVARRISKRELSLREGREGKGREGQGGARLARSTLSLSISLSSAG